MEFECVCGAIILFPSPERQGGFIELQTKILQQKGYKGISYVTKANKIVSVLEDGTVKVFSPQGQLMENYPQLLGEWQ